MRALAIWHWVAIVAVLVAANVAVFAIDALAFMWPVMGLVDAGSVLTAGRRRRVSP
jgi:hypothetical protein